MMLAARAWASLSMYESTDLVKRFAKQRTGRSPNTTRAREISAHFAQGREYFRNAAGAGELVRPLILYYGVAALVRGTVLFLDTSKSKLEAAHGLDATGWDDLLTRPRRLPEAKVKIGNGGTFPELARLVGNTEWVRVHTGESPGVADAESPGTGLAAEATLTIKEILGQIPDVAALYERTFGEHSRRLRAEISYTGLTRSTGDPEPPPDENRTGHSWVGILPSAPPLRFPEKGWAEGLLASTPLGRLGRILYEGFLHVPGGKSPASYGRMHDLNTEAGSRNEPRLQMPVAADTFGEQHLKLPTDEGVVLSTLLALHLIAYAAGMLVRYHPGYWSMLVGRAEGSEIAPLLSAAVSTVEERYPALILEAIGG
ncbi:MAG: YaaC family protein [Rubrobacteraceae bacterium]